MADSPNGGNKFEPPKEMSMEMRLLLALLLTVPILFIGPYFSGPRRPRRRKKAEHSRAASSRAVQPRGRQTSTQGRAEAVAAVAPAKAAGRNGTPAAGPALDRDRHRSLPHRLQQPGRDRASWQLKGRSIKDNDGKQLELVNSAAGLAPPFSSLSPERQNSRATNSTGRITRRPPIPTGWASPTSSPTATSR